jgi:hypothetical protein
MAMNKFQRLHLGILLALMLVHACPHKPVGEPCDASPRYLVEPSFLAQLDRLWLLPHAEDLTVADFLVHLSELLLLMQAEVEAAGGVPV